MNQQINFYLKEFQPQKINFNAKVASATLLILFACLLSISVGELWYSSNLNETKIQLTQALQSANDKNNILVSNLSASNNGLALSNQIEELESSLIAKQQLLEILNGKRLGNRQGFSHYLSDLSYYHIPGLRLTNINLHSGGEEIILNGAVETAGRLPLFLQNLSHSESFNGINFDYLQIEDPDQFLSDEIFPTTDITKVEGLHFKVATQSTIKSNTAVMLSSNEARH